MKGNSSESPAKLEAITKGGAVETGTFLFDRTGQIVKRPDGAPLSFSFEYRDAPYRVEIEVQPEPRVHMTGSFGVLPYTAECSEIRPLLLSLIEKSKACKRGQLTVNADMQIELKAEASPPHPCSPESIMATVIALLSEFEDCVDLLKDLLAAKAPLPPMEVHDPSEQVRAMAAGRA